MIGKRVDLADRLVRKLGAVRLAEFDRDHRVEAKLGLGADMMRIASRIVSEDMHDVHEFRKTPVLTAEEPVEDRDHQRHFAEVCLRIEGLGRTVFHSVHRTEHEPSERIRGNVIHLGGQEDLRRKRPGEHNRREQADEEEHVLRHQSSAHVNRHPVGDVAEQQRQQGRYGDRTHVLADNEPVQELLQFGQLSQIFRTHSPSP